MADPFSIATGCIALAATVGKASVAITAFIRTTHDARKELKKTKGQLDELNTVLDLLQHDSESEAGAAIPDTIKLIVERILQSCADDITSIGRVLEKHKAKTGALRFAFTGKEEISGLNRNLRTHTDALNLALETSTL